MNEQRDELRWALSNTICNASNYPREASVHLLGRDMSEVLDKTTDTILAAGYRKPRTPRIIDADNVAEELGALPIRSVVLAHWEDGHQPDYTMMRCAEGGASSSGYGLAETRHWIGMANWGATLTVLYEPTIGGAL